MSDKKFWGNKPYFSLDHYLKQTFGEKVYRLSLNGGMTCPNRDGTLDSRGCIFCSAGGSGDFATAPSLSVTEQITQAKERIRRKSNCRKFIAYFQAYTNTYAPVSYYKVKTPVSSFVQGIAQAVNAIDPESFKEDKKRCKEICCCFSDEQEK